MPSPDPDLTYLRAGLESLEKFLLSDEVFWPLEGNQTLLSLGGLLLSDRKLSISVEDFGQKSLLPRLNTIKSRWRATWDKKIMREIHSRMRLWNNSLQEMVDGAESFSYPQEVSNRVMLDLLCGEVSLLPHEMEIIYSLDQILKPLWSAGDFVWEEKYRSAFPISEFWYLYGAVKQHR